MNRRMLQPELRDSPHLHRAWPPFGSNGRWPATRDYLHLASQMLGKLRLALAPPQPEWFHTPLALGAQGLTTGAMPWRSGALEAGLIIPDHLVRLSASDGRTGTIELDPARPIAEIWASFNNALRDLGVAVELWDKPQERSDTTPLSRDDRPRTRSDARRRLVRAPSGAPGDLRTNGARRSLAAAASTSGGAASI